MYNTSIFVSYSALVYWSRTFCSTTVSCFRASALLVCIYVLWLKNVFAEDAVSFITANIRVLSVCQLSVLLPSHCRSACVRTCALVEHSEFNLIVLDFLACLTGDLLLHGMYINRLNMLIYGLKTCGNPSVIKDFTYKLWTLAVADYWMYWKQIQCAYIHLYLLYVDRYINPY